MKLSELPPGRQAVVEENACKGPLAQRLEDLGMTEGLTIRCLHRAPFGSPVAYEIRGAAIALRQRDAKDIQVREVAP